MTTLHPHLRYYCELGWALIPLRRGGKGALVKWKHIDSPPSMSEVLWWQEDRSPTDWAVLLGPSNLVVFDIDDVEAWYRYQIDFDLEIPRTPTVKTPGGGLHFYFEAGPEDLIRTVPRPFGFDGEYRAGRNIVKVPFGNSDYHWVVKPQYFKPVPEWMRQAIEIKTTPPDRPKNQKSEGDLEKWLNIGFDPNPAARHVYLVAINRSMIEDGLTWIERLQVLDGINKNFTAGAKSDDEVERIAQWKP